jgi:hypothetical protein
MEIVIYFMPLAFLLALVVYISAFRRNCPECGEAMPLFYLPSQKTKRMWHHGGYLCARCGCETDSAGVKVDDSVPSTRSPQYNWIVFTFVVLSTICVALMSFLLVRQPS